MSATQLVAGFIDGDFTPVDAAQAVIDRVEALDAQVHAYVATDPALSLIAAAASTRRYRERKPLSALDGVPFSVKDTFGTEDFPTRFGSRARFDMSWLGEDAPVVARLKDAGAVPIGKTATPELSFGGVTDTHHASTRNPWDITRTSGGSSGGAAVAASLGMGAIHIGADTGGSVRMPAAFCGVVGLKATHDRVPYWPWSAFAPYDHIGAITRTAADAALALEVIARPDQRVSTRLPALPPLGLDTLSRGIAGWRIGVLEVPSDVPLDAEVRRLYDAAVATLQSLGAICEPVVLDTLPARTILLTVAAVGLAELVDRVHPDDKHLLNPQIVEFASLRERLTAVDYVACLEGREAFANTVNAHFKSLDLIVTPTVAITAFAGGFSSPQDGPYADGGRAGEWTPFTYAFNLSRNPAVTCPIGLSRVDGLPVGLQIVGPLYREDMVLQAAQSLELALAPAIHPPILRELESNQ